MVQREKVIYYIYSTLLLTTIDFDKQYNELLKNALKYGMSKNEFYECDYEDFLVYQEAYFEKLHETSHIQGYYNYIAYSIVLEKAFSKNSKNEYPKQSIYAENLSKGINIRENKNKPLKITKSNVQQVFMNRLNQCY